MTLDVATASFFLVARQYFTRGFTNETVQLSAIHQTEPVSNQRGYQGYLKHTMDNPKMTFEEWKEAEREKYDELP